MTSRLLTAVKPTGNPHIGNYFGAMLPFITLTQDASFEPFVFIADYHAMTTMHNGDELNEQIFSLLADYLAIGIDTSRVTIYTQSTFPEFTELMWILSTLMTVPQLERAHAYKDRITNGVTPTVGLFMYPVLMASDILLAQGNVIPVGNDQRQHVEIARELAQKFNNTYGETFVLPEEYIQNDVAIVPGTDGRKMSKSYNNTIPLFGTDREIEKAIMSIVTDSTSPEDPKDPEKDTLFALHTLITPPDILKGIREGYIKGGLGYGDSKKILLEHTLKLLRPMREKREMFISQPEKMHRLLKEGNEKMRPTIKETMTTVKERVGLR